MTKTTITGTRLLEIRSGLAVLKEKRLPSADAEMLVVSMWSLLRPAFELYDELARKLQHEMQDAEASDDPEVRVSLLRQTQAKAREIPTMAFVVDLPKTRIQQQHLPKPHKGKDGDENPTGNAGIAIALGPEFFEFPDSSEPS